MTWIQTELSKKNGTFLLPISHCISLYPTNAPPGLRDSKNSSGCKIGSTVGGETGGGGMQFLWKRNRNVFPPVENEV